MSELKPWEVKQPPVTAPAETPAAQQDLGQAMQQLAEVATPITSFAIVEQPLSSMLGPDPMNAIADTLEVIQDQDLHQGHQKSILAKILRWSILKVEMAKLKAEESELRKLFLGHYFSKAKEEGTTREQLPDGYALKAEFGLDRKIDETVLPGVLARISEASRADLIKYEPKLNLKAYRALSKEDRLIMDEALIIKPSSTQLTLEEPKEPK